MFSRFFSSYHRIPRSNVYSSLTLGIAATAAGFGYYQQHRSVASSYASSPIPSPSDEIIRDPRTPHPISLPEKKLASLFPLVPVHRLSEMQMSDVGQYSITKDLSVLDHFLSDILPSHLVQEFILQRLHDGDNDTSSEKKNGSNRLRVVDATGGMGGTSMYFLSRGCDVTAFELQPPHCSMLKNNLSVFREALAESKIFDEPPSFSVRCECFATALQSSANDLKGDIIVIEPPWGGPEVMTQQERLINVGLGNLPVSTIVNETIGRDKFRLAFLALPPLFDYSRLMRELNNDLNVLHMPWRNYSYVCIWKRPSSLTFPKRIDEY